MNKPKYDQGSVIKIGNKHAIFKFKKIINNSWAYCFELNGINFWIYKESDFYNKRF